MYSPVDCILRFHLTTLTWWLYPPVSADHSYLVIVSHSPSWQYSLGNCILLSKQTILTLWLFPIALANRTTFWLYTLASTDCTHLVIVSTGLIWLYSSSDCTPQPQLNVLTWWLYPLASTDCTQLVIVSPSHN